MDCVRLPSASILFGCSQRVRRFSIPPRSFFRGDPRRPPKGPRIIDKPFVGKLRVIAEDGEQLGILEVRDAIAIAEERELDLVEIAPTADPPTCKLMDYGKYKYQQKKKGNNQRKAVQRQKEIKLRPKTDAHDLLVKVERARGFLEKGHKVQVTMVFRGREAIHVDVGRGILRRFYDTLEDCAKVEKEPTKESRNRMSMILARR